MIIINHHRYRHHEQLAAMGLPPPPNETPSMRRGIRDRADSLQVPTLHVSPEAYASRRSHALKEEH